MTVVMQHWFDDLEVTDDGFSVTLNFGEQPEPLYIPYDAIKTFVDPSVEFGLRFETHATDDDDLDDDGDDDEPTPRLRRPERGRGRPARHASASKAPAFARSVATPVSHRMQH